MEDQIIWVAGELLSEDGWQILGVFDSEQAAIACCELPSDFVAPLPTGKILNRDEKGWPGLYFPKRLEHIINSANESLASSLKMTSNK